MSLKITTLIENNSDKSNILCSEHGLSLYIEINEKKILFDTGQSGEFIKNAEKLKIDLNDLNYVVFYSYEYFYIITTTWISIVSFTIWTINCSHISWAHKMI